MPVSLGERVLPIDVRTNQSLPAFTACSLDDNPGNGNPADGDTTGQANLYLFWETETIVDSNDRWEMTVGLIEKAPQASCTVNVTPRRCQTFRPPPKTTVRWRSTSGSKDQTGQVLVDRWGLITLEGVTVTKMAKTRISISR